MSHQETDLIQMPRALFERFIDAVCYAVSLDKVELRPASPKARKSPEVMAGFGLCVSSSPP
jgi:hypothetical protein